jgi:hypothetical protein
MAEYPKPNPAPLGAISPTLANDLLSCALRVAWRLDVSYASLRRPSTFSELGMIAHAVVEDVGKGLLAKANTPGEARELLEADWRTHQVAREANLAAAWAPAQAPPAEQWPGYQLTRARVIRRGVRSIGRYIAPRSAASQVESRLDDPATGLTGRPDRVEGPSGDRCVVDLKTGLAQADPTPAQRRQLLLYAYLVSAETGEIPTRMAVEDASGKRWSEAVDADEVRRTVDEVIGRRDEFDTAVAAGAIADLASPSADTCRYCPYRVVCGSYWTSLTAGWAHPSVAGEIVDVHRSPAGSVLTVLAESPVDDETEWLVTAVPSEDWRRHERIGVVGAELSGARSHLRWRWTTVAWAL